MARHISEIMREIAQLRELDTAITNRVTLQFQSIRDQEELDSGLWFDDSYTCCGTEITQEEEESNRCSKCNESL
tara:strand:+ start:1066 stop:1287 length:222 start_codon:yes stop_codon:yes gene_type:complete